MADIEAPVLGEYQIIPKIKLGTMAGSMPYIAKPDIQAGVGFPKELVPDWENVAVKKLGEMVSESRALQVFLDSCVKCGACTDKCHYYLGTSDPKNMPVARQDLLRSVYRRYYTFAGKHFPKLVGARDMTKDVLDEWYNYFHQCSQCRRCSVFCPYGIDTAEISMAAREIMDTVGQGQKYCNEVLIKLHSIGNNLGLPGPALANTLEGLEEDVKDDTGVDVKYPVDVKGAEVLLVTPSADFFAEPHVDGLIGYGKVFHAAGTSWTLSSHASEAGNFGMFIGSNKDLHKVARRIREAALELGVKRIIVGECGHAWRVAYSFWNSIIGPFDFLDQRYPIPQHICEFTYDLIQRKALKFDKSANDDKVVTFHDSCNVARASRMGNMPGGQFIIPRAVVRASVNKFFDMAPETIYESTYCCGGGGGLLTDELLDLRIKGTAPRMQAFKEVVEEHGVTHIAAICAICKAQFTKVLPYYKFPMDTIQSVHGLVSKAIRLGAVNE
ncbi:MAG TPA: (Fe-S)-binding protein [Sulfuricaulis sp.]|nr:(Fe-S)-binding protein [Gammaproteobacteria bacterium]HEU5338517.1 (Fe-S)-binding protein [Sulfuricaulis sp.]MDH3370847.1 (Fe-S)-binding protein [Gammaproteobacteria bacterium]MDH3406508.1 (Fe-S)-binding protein [Gammaproteobacteria bacterium]MDH3562763.1 (Fe-S)-binding protein [Gammaproteobacteria bacterium]